MTVTKAELAAHLRDTIGFSAGEAKAIVECFFGSIRRTLASGESVQLSGFGKFTLRDKRARPGRNPRTGAPSEICARRVVTFHASPTLKAGCNPQLEVARNPYGDYKQTAVAN